MEVIFHPLAQRDVLEILHYYHEISPKLEAAFYDELRSIIASAAQNPLRFHLTDRGFRRANLKRFPYHVLYEARSKLIRVMHHKRRPEFGLERL